MSRYREEGYGVVSLMDGSGEFRVARSTLSRLKSEWMKGGAFIEFRTFAGMDVTLKSARLVLLMDCSPEAIETHRELIRQEKLEDKAEEITE